MLLKPLDKLLNIFYTKKTMKKKIRNSDTFDNWFGKLHDKRAIAKIAARIDRLAEGNPGDVEPIGEGCSELRIHFGPGYRVYYKDAGREIILLLCGGDKSTQQKDINKALEIARFYEEGARI